VTVNQENILNLNQIQSAKSAEEPNKNQRPESTKGQMTKKQIEERFKNVFNGEGKLEGSFSFEILLELVKSRTASVSTCIGPGVLRKLSNSY
jgi:hypothetical protein